jgi:hypothetical protein
LNRGDPRWAAPTTSRTSSAHRLTWPGHLRPPLLLPLLLLPLLLLLLLLPLLVLLPLPLLLLTSVPKRSGCDPVGGPDPAVDDIEGESAAAATAVVVVIVAAAVPTISAGC